MKLSTGIVAIATLLFTPVSVLANPMEEIIGKVIFTQSNANGVTYYGLPKETITLGGSIVGNVFVEQPYVVSLYEYGFESFISFEQILAQRQMSRPEGLLNVQQVKILDMRSPEFALNASFYCQVNQQDDAEVFAFADPVWDVNMEWITNLKSAWRANRKTQKLEEIPTENIRCYNMAYGL